MILDHMPFFAQILFFGALVSAIKSCSSATLLAPSTSFVENILRHIYPHLRDKQLLLAMRITIFVFTSLVLTYAILTEGTPIYELVSNAYQVTLAGSFVPLTAGLYWRRATTQGAIFSIVLGVLSWAVVTFCNSIPIAALQGIDEVFPAQLVALGFAVFGMVFGSLGPQWIKNICHINLNYLGIVPIEEQPTAHSHHHSH